MNYFAHGRPFVDDPYFLIGTALPDWLNVVDRRARLRPPQVRPAVEAADPRASALARGVLQHFHDDDWFHRTAAFATLSWRLTAAVRDVLDDTDGLRPSFLGHILVEILLDAELIADDPARLEAYYAALMATEPAVVEQAVNRIASRPVSRLAESIPLFCQERFLFDYQDDARLWFRLNQVMRRVTLPPLPESFCTLLPEARCWVAAEKQALLTPGDAGAEPTY